MTSHPAIATIETPLTTAVAKRAARTGRFFEPFRPISPRREIVLGLLAWLTLLGVWYAVVAAGWANPKLLPYPHQVLQALAVLVQERGYLGDVWVSILRVLTSFGAAAAIAIPLGLLMGSFRSIEAIVNPIVSPARYLPAPSFAPLLLMWFGAGDLQKLMLLGLGVIWFLVTLVADVAKDTREDLVETSLTLGGNRRDVFLTVVVPQSLPGIVTALRQMLAVSWTYLVIAEIIAATDGIGAMMMRAKRFVRTDDIMAGILTIGLLGIAFDLLFRALHRAAFPYLWRSAD